MTVRLLHSADIHVDSPLRGLSRAGDAPVDELRGASRTAVENLVELAVAEQVACLVIAGDLYDGDRDDFDTAVFLQRQFARLVDSGVAVVVCHGNHDAASEITRRLRPPPGVRVLAHDEPETVALEDAGLGLHGQGYPTRAVTDDLSAAYPPPVPGLANVGVLHTALTGRPGHDLYAPCTLEELMARGYAYWALGHVHERDVMEVDGRYAVFPGNLQGRHAREAGPKGATLVTFDGDQVSRVEHRDLDAVRWARVAVDASGTVDVDDVCARIAEAAANAAPADGKLCALRAVVTGATQASDRLIADRERWEAQLRADLAGATGRLWLEKVDVLTSRPRADRGAGEAMAAVRGVVARLCAEPPQDLDRIFDPLRVKLGAELDALRAVDGPDLRGEGVTSLLTDVESMLAAELWGG